MNTNSISRVDRTRAQAQASYDRISGWYDLLEGYWERQATTACLNALNAKTGERVLEIGFGTGHAIIALAHAVGATGRVYGIDLSPRMLALTQARVNKGGLAPRVELRHGDALHLPYDSEFFDALLMSFVLELFDTPEIPQVLRECGRVLKRGGRVGTVSLSKTGGRSVLRNLYEWGHERFPALLDCRPIFVQRALEDAAFQTRRALPSSLWGLPVEIVIAVRGD